MFWNIATVFFFGTWKFIYAPFWGPIFKLGFFETFIASFAGGMTSATVIYFGSNRVLKWLHRRKLKKRLEAEKRGIEIPKRPVFTKRNRMIIKIKQKLGFYFVLWAFPLFLSIPIGTIICAKFYRHNSSTFLFIILFLALNAFGITFGVYYLGDILINA